VEDVLWVGQLLFHCRFCKLFGEVRLHHRSRGAVSVRLDQGPAANQG
jgi:hypothetical protein